MAFQRSFRQEKATLKEVTFEPRQNIVKDRPRVDLQEERSRMKKKGRKTIQQGQVWGRRGKQRSPRAESASRGSHQGFLVDMFDLNSKCSGKI